MTDSRESGARAYAESETKKNTREAEPSPIAPPADLDAFKVLKTEDYEAVAAAHTEVERSIKMREDLGQRRFSGMMRAFLCDEELGRLVGAQEQRLEMRDEVINDIEARVSRYSPRVADMCYGILARMRGDAYVQKFPENAEKLEELEQTGDLDLLLSPHSPWDIKLNRMDTRLIGYLAGRQAFDRREGHQLTDEERERRAQRRSESTSRTPEGKPAAPPREREFKPGMNELERNREGERTEPTWLITPGYGGYWRRQAYSVWDSQRSTWIEPESAYSEVRLIPPCEKPDPRQGKMNIKVSATVHAGEWMSLQSPYAFGLSAVTCKAPYELRQDRNGDMMIRVEGIGYEELSYTLSPQPKREYGPTRNGELPDVPNMPAKFSEQTAAAIEESRNRHRGSLARAKALASYVRKTLQYSNDSKYNDIYKSHPDGYFAAIEEHRQADCDVGNTYFAALAAAAGLRARLVVGDSVKAGLNTDGSSQIDSGTGHAWTEVWESEKSRWVRLDATPPGDPNLENKEEKSESLKSAPGDYPSTGVSPLGEEKLRELEAQLAKRKRELSYTREERHLAQAGGVELSEAREIVREIASSEAIRLPNGKRITDVLSELFTAIVETRKTPSTYYDGPVTRKEGGQGIQDIVRHYVAQKEGVRDPSTRERIEDTMEDDESVGGVDYYMIGDKSGSMSAEAHTDGVSAGENEALIAMQRRASYLVLSSWHRFSQALKRSPLAPEDALDVRSECISFRGETDDLIDVDKPLSSMFTAADKVKMWHSLGKEGVGNGDVAALKYVYGQILAEVEAEKASGKKAPKRIRMVIACSDGGPDDPVQVQQYAEALGKLGAVVVGIGMTANAVTVPAIYTTPFSRGDIAYDIDDLPAIIAKHLVMEAVRLFPKRASVQAKSIVAKALSQFTRRKPAPNETVDAGFDESNPAEDEAEEETNEQMVE